MTTGRRAHDRPARAGHLQRGRHRGEHQDARRRASTRRGRPSRRRASSGSPRTATSWKASRARPGASRGTSGSTTSSSSTTTTTSPSTARPSSRSARTSASATRRTAGSSSTSTGTTTPQIRAALDKAVAEPSRPSLIVARTHIGIGSPKQDSEKAHGEPLGADAVKATKKKIGWPARADVPRPRRGARAVRRARRGRQEGARRLEESVEALRQGRRRQGGALHEARWPKRSPRTSSTSSSRLRPTEGRRDARACRA